MPPRHGKSELTSKYLPAWYLGTFPMNRVILTSYEASFAAQWGRKARNLLEEHGNRVFGLTVAESPSAADHWDVAGCDGGMQTAGAGGPITGKGAHLLICDDPIKNAEEANSDTHREKIWDWWQSTAYTRLEPDGCAIVIQTRWHEDDLAGRLLKDAAEEGENWRLVNMPAIGDDGAALWPDRYSIEKLRRIERAVGSYYWSALYQQRPTPKEGSQFKVGKLGMVDAAPVGLRLVRAWDMASTPSGGDYTAGVKIGAGSDGFYYVLHVERGQWSTEERNSMIRQTAELDGRSVRIRGPQDPGSAGVDAAKAFTRMLAGFPVKTEKVTGSKETRADPFSAQVNAGNVRLVRGPWNKAFIDELRAFPHGANDDQVDAASDAFTELAGGIRVLVA